MMKYFNFTYKNIFMFFNQHFKQFIQPFECFGTLQMLWDLKHVLESFKYFGIWQMFSKTINVLQPFKCFRVIQK
jgi:hypothetical protein